MIIVVSAIYGAVSPAIRVAIPAVAAMVAIAVPALARQCVRGRAKAAAVGILITYIWAARASAVVAVTVATLIIFPSSRSMTSCRRW
jgi:hypothetical protein